MERNIRSFTIIELLIVILILGALSAISVTRFTDVRTRARLNTFSSNLDIIERTLEQYRNQQVVLGNLTQLYPPALNDPTFKSMFTQEPINPYTNKSMLSGTPESGIQYATDGTNYKICVTQTDVDDVNKNGFTNDFLPLPTICIGTSQTQIPIVFERSSIAYTTNGQQTMINTPRYESGKFRQSIFIEEGTTNLLENSSFENGLTGWSRNQASGCQVEIVDMQHNGNKVGKLSCNQSKHNWFHQRIPSSQGLTHGYYTVSADINVENYVSGFVGTGMYIYYTDSTYTSIFKKIQNIPSDNLNKWSRFVATGSSNSNKTLSSIIVYGTWSNILNGTLYGDSIQLEKKPYATSWTDGAREKEVLYIPNGSNFVSTSAGSVSLWFKINSLSPTDTLFTIFDIGDTGNYSLAVFVHSSGKISIQYSLNNIPNGMRAGNVVPNEWYHLVFTWDSNGYKIYLNGAEIMDIPGTPTFGIVGDRIYLGSHRGYQRFLNGFLDDVTFYSRALTAQEIQTIYNSGQPAPLTPDVTLKLPFDGSLQAHSGAF